MSYFHQIFIVIVLFFTAILGTPLFAQTMKTIEPNKTGDVGIWEFWKKIIFHNSGELYQRQRPAGGDRPEREGEVQRGQALPQVLGRLNNNYY